MRKIAEAVGTSTRRSSRPSTGTRSPTRWPSRRPRWTRLSV